MEPLTGALTSNPFAALTTVVAPAVLTNACSVLCLGTANRIARVVDRSREVAAEFEELPPEQRGRCESQLAGLRQRAKLLFFSLRLLYASLGAFATAALVSVIGAASASFDVAWAATGAAAVALLAGTAGVAGTVTGCTLMVEEVRLALKQISEEAEAAMTAPSRKAS
ncbi:MAG: DUF2721 domain-containing protein [Acidobacteria bacterium]|nr:DUF2721 domain-containing protein [Acidobacteriota bacterium]